MVISRSHKHRRVIISPGKQNINKVTYATINCAFIFEFTALHYSDQGTFYYDVLAIAYSYMLIKLEFCFVHQRKTQICRCASDLCSFISFFKCKNCGETMTINVYLLRD